MTSMRRFEIIAGNLAACSDAGIGIAASRWGATGLLNLEGLPAPEAASALSRFLAHARGSLGVKIDGSPELRSLLGRLPASVSTVVLATSSSDLWPGLVPAARGSGRRVLCECTCEEHARLADACGADGIVAKGSEAGGHVLEETTFVLAQRLSRQRLPVWAAGGIGVHSAAACYVAGCAGIVVDAALALARESTLSPALRAAIERMEGDEAVCIGNAVGDPFRLHRRSGTPVVEDLSRLEQQLADEPTSDAVARWRAELRRRMASSDSREVVWPLGQDASFAAPLARRHRTVSGILGALRGAIDAQVRSARDLKVLAAGAPLAASHRTRYPILQGPMTRVSDTPEFALAVAEAGALPFVALALMSGAEVRRLLEQTRTLLGNRPWGVGILGFVPPELRERQLEAIREIKPTFALIAGGRPDQAANLEGASIPTYLHVPSPGLLRAFLEGGARRFIFEGRECGGHVGPRTSFVLWNTMVDVLTEAIESGVPAADLHVVFAGGIHDARSAAMVAALSAPLAALGARIGVLLGTAYLLTEEAVKSRAIVEDFQREARDCTHTVLFETGPGHAIRCADTPYFQTFRGLKLQLTAEGRSPDEIRDALEELNLGRLRIASKGITRESAPDGRPAYVAVDADRQRVDGMYMLGQVAALRTDVCRMGDLHENVSQGSTTWLASLDLAAAHDDAMTAPAPCDVAIVGMGCVVPGAADVRAFWSNVLNKVDAITEVPRDRFDVERYFDPDGKARDRIVSRWGGFLGDVPFDPVRYGIPPSALPSIDSMQLLALEVVHQALADANYLDREFARERTAVIFGASGGLGDLGLKYGVRASLPDLIGEPPADLMARLPEWTEDSFAGILLNVTAGRVANRFNFGGVNYTVDAACASSLAAVHLAVRELQARTSDVAVVGGVDTVQSPFGYMCFSKSQALSPRGRCRTFDQSADGIAISEAVVAFVIKRLADAERDGDRIYAVIKGVAGSSDGRGKGLTAPRPEGQMRALRRAYAQAGVEASSIGLIEAHGTGTVAGDAAEVASLDEVFRAAGAAPESCAIGSVKSMIGHTKASAGVAGLMKAALALHHRVLPPTLHVTQPNPRLREEGSPFFVNTEPTPWIAGSTPRRAGVSSFGFGGTNFHAVVEEYTGGFVADERTACDDWPAELFVWSGPDHDAIEQALRPLRDALAQPEPPALRALAAAVCRASASPRSNQVRLAIVASSLDDLRAKVVAASEAIAAGRASMSDPRGIFLGQGVAAGQVAFLFPGQGSQSPNMLRDVAVQFGEMTDALQVFDRVLHDGLPRRLSAFVYPPPAFSPEEEQARAEAITDTEVAQPALGAVEAGLIAVLGALGVTPDMTAGHSYGEYVALHAAGVMDAETLAALSHTRGRIIKDAVAGSPGTMAAVTAPADAIRAALADRTDVWLVNFNAPQQTIIAGTVAAIESAMVALEQKRIRARRIPVACAFHTPLMQGARDRLAEALASTTFEAPRIPVFSNALAAPYPTDARAIAAILADHLVSPVQFIDEIRAMYAVGARVFIEVGPRTVLTGLARRILDEANDAVVVAVDSGEKNGVVQLLIALAQIVASGVSVNTAPLFDRRAVERLDPLLRRVTVRPPATWVVNGAGARPAGTRPVSTSVPVQIAAPAPPAPSPNAAQPVLVTTDMADVHVPPPLPSVAPRPDHAAGADEVMLQFQQMMSRFLETQAAIMTAYLGGHHNGHGAANGNGHGEVAIPREVVVAPVDLRAQPRVEIAGSLFATPLQAAPSAPAGPEPTPEIESEPAASTAPAQPAAPDFAALLTQVAADRTGYAPEMLDPALSIEADLGIDSIKRVEILSAVRRQCSDGDQAKLQAVMDTLTRAKTFREMAAAMTAAVSAGEVAAPTPTAAAAAAGASVVEKGSSSAPRSASASIELLQIVAERTGYPQEMLDPDLNIEADLGIDSIKRVEILSTFRRKQPEADQQRLQAVMDRLTGIKTLRELARVIDQTLGGSEISTVEAPAAAGVPAPQVETPISPLARTVFTVIDAPALVPSPGAARREALTLVTDDGRGIAGELCARLAADGHSVLLLKQADGDVVLRDGECLGDWTDEEQVARALDRVRALGSVGSLVHAAPLGTQAGLDVDIDEWRRRVRTDVRQLYLLLRALTPDLQKAARSGDAAVLAATALGGDYGQTGGRDLPPSHGGVIGFLRTAAIELPDVRCRIVDVEPDASAEAIAGYLRGELHAEGPLEIGYIGDRRVTLLAQPAPLTTGAVVPLTSDDVVLLTGGARGITAELAIDLARRSTPTLILAGRSPEPPARETGPWASVDDGALKNAIAADMRRRDPAVRPVEVETACRRVLAEREIRRTLESCAAAGARVEYHSVDVRDHEAFGGLIEAIYARHGRLSAVVHGAGVIEDKLISDKTPASFDRVVHTKTDSVLTLAHKLRPEGLRALVLMSSVTAAFGNRGQADYGAANGVYNVSAQLLASQWPARVVALNWGPWDKRGMASEEVRRQFVARGIVPIEPALGVRAVVEELSSGDPSDAVVVLGAGPWASAAPPRAELEVTA